jgi:hypothetical protein
MTSGIGVKWGMATAIEPSQPFLEPTNIGTKTLRAKHLNLDPHL